MKICVCGSPGAGKSTISTSLSNQYGIEIFHLDELFIDYDQWKKKTYKERVQIQKDILDTNSDRIIDGNFGDTMKERIQACEKLYILDIPPIVCVYRIIKRYIQTRFLSKNRIGVGNKKPTLSRAFILLVRNYHKEKYYELTGNNILNNIIEKGIPNKNIHIVTRKDQIINKIEP